jgi:pimeloyl-ACP methyl ester carboxylesterase
MAIAATASAKPARPPHLFWTLTEGRAMFELGAFYAMRGLMSRLPHGDGHPVLVLPGFLASDSSTAPMRSLLDDLGYKTYGWGLGRNLRVDDKRVSDMLDMVRNIHAETGQKISIIGWSLGGVFARELAKLAPEAVRFVITLGSPISDDRNHTNARHLFEMLNGKEPEPLRKGQFVNLAEAPPVPTTSILTRTDGVVAWRGSVQGPADHDKVENIEVHASHIGLGVNPSVMIAIADRLAQKEGSWEPFKRSGLRSVIFPEFRAQ